MKFILSSYKNGNSIVIMYHLKRFFRGIAKLHPDDKDKASEYAGCAYAEARATIKALKYERKLLKQDTESCRKFIKACECYKNWDKKSPSAKAAYRQLNKRIKRVNDITDEINRMMYQLNQSMWQRDITLKAFEQNKQNKLKDKSEN